MQRISLTRTVAIVGLDYVGLPLAVEFGKTRKVVGFNINGKCVAEMQAGHEHTLEVEPTELRQATHLSYATDPAALAECDVFIVTIPTPIDAHKRPNLTSLIKASATIGKSLAPYPVPSM